MLVALLAGACGAAEPDDGFRCEDCNIILVSIDTLRADHLGCYGYKKPTSPSVDAFSGDAILFRTAVAAAPSTEPSHASIFTSMIPAHHGAFRAHGLPISPDVVTLPEIMQRAGYRTISYNGGGQVSANYGFDRGFEVYDSTRGENRFSEKVDAAIEWIDHNPGERFFFFLHTYEVHAPYRPTRENLELIGVNRAAAPSRRIDAALLKTVNLDSAPIPRDSLEHMMDLYDAGIRSIDTAFGRLVDYLRRAGLYDSTIIVFTSDHGEEFGEHGDVARHSHSLYDELLLVPLIVKLPGSQYASSRIERQVRSIDIMPTLLDVSDVEYAGPMQGRSLIPLVQGNDTEPFIAVSQQDEYDPVPPISIRADDRKLILRSALLPDETQLFEWYQSSAPFDPVATFILPIASIDRERIVEVTVDGQRPANVRIFKERRNVELRGQRGKTLTVRSLSPCQDLEGECVSFRVFNPYEYYMLDADPAEQHNLYENPANSHAIAELRALLASMLAEGADAVQSGQPVEIDERTRRRLRALGYMP